jgi:zinc protease
MINRTISPRFKQVEDITFIKAEQLTFNNGLTAYVINGGDQELIRIELFFKNVNWDFQKPLLAFAVNTMLNDGTTEFTAFQLAESVDYYGAFLQTDYSYDHSSITLYTLNKHLEVTLKVLKTIITDSIFPQVELATFIRNQKQKLRVNLEKNDVIGRRVLVILLVTRTTMH